MQNKNEFIRYSCAVSVFLLGILLLAFPLVFTSLTTDIFVLPKQILLGAIVIAVIILFALKLIAEGSIRLRRTIFDLPLILFAFSVFLSSILSANKNDSLITFVPLLFAILGFFAIVNVIKTKSSLLFLVSSFIFGGAILSLNSILSFFKIYILPFSFTHVQTFSPLGSLLDQSIYLTVALGLGGYLSWPLIGRLLEFSKNSLAAEKSDFAKRIIYTIASIVIAMGLFVTVYSVFSIQKPPILPLEIGFQTAFATISQDTGRIVQGFLFGSGFGTYANDFTRFKQAAFNQNQALWTLIFFRSSSFLLEVLATAGILGFAFFIFLASRIVKEVKGSKEANPISFALILILIASIILPLSFVTQTLIFLLLGLFAVSQGLGSAEKNKYFDVEFQLVALREGLISLEPAPSAPSTKIEKTKLLPFASFLIAAVVLGFLSFWSIRYLLSDLTFQESLIAATQNNGSLTYQKQANAIQVFNYRDAYHRIFSQTNLALANSLASQQKAGSSPSAQVQQTISTLIQQSINEGRNATTLSPQTSLNWQNLSSIYRSLIGFGQNAESFAIATEQQAIFLNPNDPQQYLNLGGIYYQLGQWDNAQNQFQIAINLKPDFANAYYNLAHTLQQKQDLTNALQQLQIVKNLVVSDKTSSAQVDKEIVELSATIQKTLPKETSKTNASSTNQPPLNLNTPATQLPAQNPPVKIPAPNTATSSSQ